MSTDAQERRGAVNRRTGAQVILLCAAIAGIVAALLAALSTSQALILLGIPDPGALTTFGIPALTALGETSAVVAVGSLLLAAFLVPPQRSGVLDIDGYVAVRAAAKASAVWAVCAALLVPLTLSDASGQPVGAIAGQPLQFLRAIGDVDVATAWMFTSLIGAATAVGCAIALRHNWTPALLTMALFALMPRAVSGHSSTGGNHDIATNSLILHILAAALWAGGLLALLVHALRGGGHLALATRRYSTIALIAFVTMAASGVINAAVRVPLDSLWESTYGILVLAKVAALTVVGVLGWRQRRNTVGALALDPANRKPLITLSLIEALVLVTTIGLAVALGRTPPPAPESTELPQAHEEALGFVLDGPPTAARLAFEWRFDLLFGSAAILLATLYLIALRRRRAAGLTWRRRWTASWLAGTAVLLIATSSGVGLYSPAMFSVHMAGLTAVAIATPLLLVIGRPITLVASILPTASPGAAPGLRRWLSAAFHSRTTAFLLNPWIGAAMLLGSFYLLYSGGVFDFVADSHVAHAAMKAWFLIVGLLFFWGTVGLDPTPRPISGLSKLLSSILALAGFAFFLVSLIDIETALGGTFYSGLRLDWNSDLLADQRLAGNLAWGIGELPLLAAAVLAAVRWSAADENAARRRDQAIDDTGDEELDAYNSMLDDLSSRPGNG
ncbi:bifunctional copper resistance protein CopD/cytochrome c oxidase assembly protein [Rhodococcus sp. BP-252]|uniref:Copper resistance protein CopD n=1 Tax=Rhodococcoides kyotonense TaxID=398843 RepID=A0A177YKZ1_9NOCA|nr:MULTISPECIES: cytochrome c oxidase assembly protein [Rhodococcus]MBY6413947.1 bifunctional copper resistance protein CopD/cytochrome c oxidase assembly protein [Rhodococcus sp. BP-320]MBY6418603.1 bifunctional copper resistance protein CopD/cytochrome c oxidase assembly protein [Rhodococcus sp. BP-321]MBY6422898.1 bifunctional copper resistance protein CopD/cytochrome c oxidase assembly protein [Rhodococcus sp. BP-324]MBY6428753.1 bifunctional copper resistance protein CopD/cytochrome c oxid